MNTILVCIVVTITISDCAVFLDLNGEWKVSNKNNYTNIKANVPGGIYSDLMNSGIIGDIFYGNNDVDTKWIPRMNWTYSRYFSILSEILYLENINIVFEGLDTFSSIYINDKLIGKSENMFVQYIFNIKKYLKEGSNKIDVAFFSPVEVANNLDMVQSKNYTIPPRCPPTEYNGECHVNMIRKMQASFSWDWGPSFPSVGIWKNVYIEAYNESVIRYVVSDVTEKDIDHWNVNIDIYLANNIKNIVNGKIQIDFKLNFVNISKSYEVNVQSNDEEIILNTTIEIPKTYVTSWWINGYGASDLYLLYVTFQSSSSFDKSSKQIRIGFRTIELIQNSIGDGLSFYFKVNGIPIFMKGSNVIPIDILPERGTNKTKVKKLLTAARDSHMNMIRVWGGGVYESDYFYDLADEYGILVWQDFMFACGMYPATENYLKNVLTEVRHQVKRLYSHPSIAIFSGNNENEGALRQNWYNTVSNYQTYYDDYVKLYVDNIKREFLDLTHNRGIFITSSPTNGKESEREGYVAQNPASTLFGDIHFYNYILDPFNSDIYPIPRFASEYGYQSLPSMQSWLSVTNNSKDLNINSIFMNHRQHHPLGNLEMFALIGIYFKLPESTGEKYNEALIFYSQIVQALAIKIESEHYRRSRFYLNEKGEGYTMGALYWQLNDVWIAPTWSGIDHLGKFKMLQYYTENFFAPVIITGHIHMQHMLNIYVVSDLLSPLINLTASVQIYKWTSLTPISVENLTINTEVGSVDLIKQIMVDNYLSENGCGSLQTARINCFFYFSLETDNIKIAPDNFVFPTAVKNTNISQAEVKIKTMTTINDGYMFTIEVITDKIALFVWLDSPIVKGKFSENGFVLVEPVRTVYFQTEEKTTESDLLKTLTITHLLDKTFS